MCALLQESAAARTQILQGAVQAKAQTLALTLRNRLDEPPPELAALPAARAAALSKLCLALFNLNEFLYID